MSVDVLVSFLGKSNKDSVKGYREATYEFSDGDKVEVPYFGLGLAKKLKPKRLVLIGTSSSMWDVFFTNQSQGDDELHMKLIEAVAENKVDSQLLKKCSGLLEKEIGCEVVSILIDFAKTEKEQVALLSKLSGVLNDDEKIAIDVTHSFRHLPMIAMVASRFLEKTRGIQTEAIYYGALEMTNKDTQLTPVIELSGLLKMLDWVDALASYEKHGDYADFAALYEREGRVESAEYLKQASFFERTNQVTRVRKPLQQFLANESENKSAIQELFAPTLKKRFEWNTAERHGERQTNLANYFLEKRDYLRAATLGYESYLTKVMQQQPEQLEPTKYEHREEIRKKLNSGDLNWSKDDKEAFKNLNNVRNALAHGTPSRMAIIQSAMADEENLHTLLLSSMQQLNKND